jgi:site-specific DNA-methyltransferase (adenine-specific)
MVKYELYTGNSINVLRTLPDNSIDSVVTDPPYEIGFMNKGWDKSGIANNTDLWKEVLRVLKPGGHLISFGGARTYHRMTCAIEDAGFEIRDCIQWIYGSGFPKSIDVSKALDRQAGAMREKVKTPITPHSTAGKGSSNELDARPWLTKARQQGYHEHDSNIPVTPEAQQWHGWGTALKPANEPAVLARKPFLGTVASNLLEWGVGALNIDGTRIATDEDYGRKGLTPRTRGYVGIKSDEYTFSNPASPLGRWTANVIFDEESAKILDEQSNTASRFFYVAKPSPTEKSAGLEEAQSNKHPTVKPVTLMEYLIRMITPPSGTVLDPFSGSGTTGCAAVNAGFSYIGVDLSAEYNEIAEARIKYWLDRQK